MVTLIQTTGYTPIDQILHGTITLFAMTFPKHMQAAYVVGSYAYGYAVPNSDLDLWLFFKEGMSAKAYAHARRLRACCSNISTIKLDIDLVVGPPYDMLPHWANLYTQVKLGGLLIYGQDIREQIPDIPMQEYIRYYMHVASLKTELFRQQTPLTYPLHAPAPQDPFYGYTTLPTAPPEQREPSTKAFITCLANMTNALVALQTHTYVKHKTYAFELHQSLINDQWSQFVCDAYTTCKDHWHYRIPSTSPEQNQLTVFCRRMLDYENHFLAHYQQFLCAELQATDACRAGVLIHDVLEWLEVSDQEMATIQAAVTQSQSWRHWRWTYLREVMQMGWSLGKTAFRQHQPRLYVHDLWRIVAVRRLQFLRFLDPAILAGLSRLQPTSDPLLRQYVHETLKHYQ